MSYFYTLDAQGNPVAQTDIVHFGRWFETTEQCVGWMHFDCNGGGIEVSTVFLGIDHSFLPGGPPVLWETMVFADEAILRRLLELAETDDRSIVAKFTGGVDIQKRYTSQAEAKRGHAVMCQFIETCITMGWLTPESDVIDVKNDERK